MKQPVQNFLQPAFLFLQKIKMIVIILKKN